MGLEWYKSEPNKDGNYYLNKRGFIFNEILMKKISLIINAFDVTIKDVDGLEIFEAGDYNNVFYRIYLNREKLM